MYFNDIHILYYVFLGIIGLFVGQFIDWVNNRLPEYKKVFSKEIIAEYKKSFKPNYILMILNSLIYVFILYKFGLHTKIIENMELIKYLILTPMILSVFVIDYKLQIIPNRLVLTMFEIGMVFVFIFGLSDINISINMLIGMFTGAGIFLIITLIGGAIAGKEAMGFGDVKFMGALGLYFGFSNILAISVMSFLIGAIISIMLIVSRIKKSDEYIPFGPFIVIASFISIFIPFEIILISLLKIFSLGMYR